MGADGAQGGGDRRSDRLDGAGRGAGRAIRRRLAVAALGLVVAAGAAELVVRALWPLPLNAVARDTVRLSEDPAWLYELDPEHPEHNRLGLRGPETTPRPTSGVRRLLVVGDSIAYGLGVAPEETLAARLERRLGAGWEVLNAGVPGWSILQEAAWFVERGVALEPAGVVLVVCLNDWTAYTVEFDQLLATEEPGQRSFFSVFYDPESSALRRFLLRSHVVRRLQMALVTSGLAGDEAWERETVREGVPLVETTSVKRYFEDRPFFAESFERLAAAVRGPLFVALVPIGRVGYERAHRERRSELEALCARVGATFVDLAELGAERAGPERPWWTGLYHADDALHPGPLGFEVLADGLAPRVRARFEDR